MIYAFITFFLGFLVDLLVAKGKSEYKKDLEIAVLRQQLRMVERKQTKGPNIPRWQKLSLAVLAHRLHSFKADLKLDALLVKPDPLLHFSAKGDDSDVTVIMAA